LNSERYFTPLFALLYLALIPLYAWAYESLPNQFFHATSKYEPNLVNDRKSLERKLELFLTRSVALTATRSRITRVRGLGIERDRVEIVVELRHELTGYDGFGKPMRNTVITTGNCLLLIPNEDIFNIDADPLRAIEVTVRRPTPPFIKEEPLLQQLFPPRTGVGRCGDDCGFLYIPWNLRDQLIAYDNALNGFPSNSTGNFERLLYLSAMTATTVGYGDIVPVTRTARLLVASEAVVEIILIGLFLNSLAVKARRAG
jgi:hypothetical protein